jgi:transposase
MDGASIPEAVRVRRDHSRAPRADRRSRTFFLLQGKDAFFGGPVSKDGRGAYLPRSNITDWSDQQLWKAYIQLTQVEAAFRIQKDQLNVRPIWHQREDRVQAHILVCFLAFVLWKSLEMWQQRAGLGNSPRTILEELARIQSHDVVLPTATHGQIRLRCVTQPDPAQAALLDRLGIILPKRMRIAEPNRPAQQIA